MENYIRHTLDSLVVNRLDILEVLVVNDGSKDASSKIAHEYETKYPNTFRVIDKENGNYGSCVNRGIKEATGKYVRVLDSDDSFDTENLEKYLEIISKLDVDVVFSDYKSVDDKGDDIKEFPRSLPKGLVLDIAECIPNFCEAILSMPEFAYRRSLLLGMNYRQTEGISFTDQEWNLKPLCHVKTVWNTGLMIYKYLVGREGQSTDPKVKIRTLNQRLKVAFSLLDTYKENSSTIYEPYLYTHIAQYLRFLYNTYLTQTPTSELNPEFEALDKYVKDCSDKMYNSLAELEYKSIRYVPLWRKRYSISLPIRLIRANIKYRDLFRKWLGCRK